jgi:Tol biopolymer transport system component
MSLQAGDKLGPYEIVALIGAGGMGEVYKARDPRLRRDVAIKISQEQFTDRFEREARAVAALNHPNICHLYDVGPNYLVMELIEGESPKGPLPLEEALRIARQIAAALEAAHEKGIVHRDLKPANIKITPDGTVKVLDFGLAKTSEPAAGDAETSPTMTVSPTSAGMILGTASYMSPEQARGKVVDKRADIWAFGVVLYEILTGKKLFHGEDIAEILASVVKEKPDLSSVPAQARPLLGSCLEKDPKKRLRDIGDAWRLLDQVPAVQATGGAVHRFLWPAFALTAILALAAGFGWYRDMRPVSRRLVQVSVDLGPDATPAAGVAAGAIISPDGTRLAFLAQRTGGQTRLLTRLLEQSQVTPLSGTEGARNPFFSPDGHWIAFFAGGRLKKIAARGGAAVTLCDAPNDRGGSWGEDGNIVFAASNYEGLSRVSETGGKLSAVSQLDTKKGEFTHRWPQVLPGAKAVLFTTSTSVNFDDASVAAQSLETGEKKILQRGAFYGRYLATSDATGHLIYLHGNTLFAAPMKPNRLELTGPAVPVLEEVGFAVDSGGGHLDFSQTGTFIFVAGSAASPDRTLAWMDSSGKLQPLPAPPKRYRHPRLSPDGKRLAVAILSSNGDSDVWVYDFERDTLTQLTFLKGFNRNPVWTPDGNHLAFNSDAEGMLNIYWTRVSGGQSQRVTEGEGRQSPYSFSPDGKRLAFLEAGRDLWTLPLEQTGSDHLKTGKPELFLQGRPLYFPQFSPDGRWIAYISGESGRYEVYVRPFIGASPAPGDKWLASTAGGIVPYWARNGRELFYMNLDRRLMVVNYTVKGGAFVVDKPRVWSERQLPPIADNTWSFDLAPDGKRVLVLIPAAQVEDQKPPTNVTFLFNFFDELRRRAPARK